MSDSEVPKNEAKAQVTKKRGKRSGARLNSIEALTAEADAILKGFNKGGDVPEGRRATRSTSRRLAGLQPPSKKRHYYGEEDEEDSPEAVDVEEQLEKGKEDEKTETIDDSVADGPEEKLKDNAKEDEDKESKDEVQDGQSKNEEGADVENINGAIGGEDEKEEKNGGKGDNDTGNGEGEGELKEDDQEGKELASSASGERNANLDLAKADVESNVEGGDSVAE